MTGGGHPHATEETVCARLVEAFGVLPYAPILSERGGLHPLNTGDDGRRAKEAIDWAFAHCERDERLMLLSWARAKATGSSIRELCREQRWPQARFERRRRHAARKIAEALNLLASVAA
jgi:hypothetical protein